MKAQPNFDDEDTGKTYLFNKIINKVVAMSPAERRKLKAEMRKKGGKDKKFADILEEHGL